MPWLLRIIGFAGTGGSPVGMGAVSLIRQPILIMLLAAWLGAFHLQARAWADGSTTPSCGPPSRLVDWPIALPEEIDLSSEVLCSLRVHDGDNIHAVLVVRHGKLVYENYWPGPDQRWGTSLGVVPHGAGTLHDVRSISKSVVSLLVGIAIDRGLIASIDEPVLRYHPNVDGVDLATLKDLRIRHLLTMTAGLVWNERAPYISAANSEFQMNLAMDPFRFVLSQAAEHAPGQKWNYSGGATQLLAGIIEKSSGKRLETFAREALFVPLGIVEFEWLKMPVSQTTAAASGLRLRPRDMAKIGQLVLSKGVWNGRRIVSEAWITESTTPSQFDVDDYPSIAYGYQWWTDWDVIDGRRIDWVMAQGLGGQRIYIVPGSALVSVITAGNYGSGEDSSQSYRVFREHVLNAVRD